MSKPLVIPLPQCRSTIHRARAQAAGAAHAFFVSGLSQTGARSERICNSKHGCQMAIARFLDRMCLAFRASGLWLRYATLQNLIPFFPWIAPPRPPPWRNPRKGRDQILPSGNPALHSIPIWEYFTFTGPPIPIPSCLGDLASPAAHVTVTRCIFGGRKEGSDWFV